MLFQRNHNWLSSQNTLTLRADSASSDISADSTLQFLDAVVEAYRQDFKEDGRFAHIPDSQIRKATKICLKNIAREKSLADHAIEDRKKHQRKVKRCKDVSECGLICDVLRTRLNCIIVELTALQRQEESPAAQSSRRVFQMANVRKGISIVRNSPLLRVRQ